MATIILDLQDNFAELRTKFNSLSNNVGDLTLLQTDEKGSIVASINEIDSDLNGKVVPGIYDRTGTLLNGS